MHYHLFYGYVNVHSILEKGNFVARFLKTICFINTERGNI